MRNYNTLYYLLFVLLILGAFASMAQNTYGLTILGTAAIAFGLIFLYQFIAGYRNKEGYNKLSQLELFSMTILSFLFALRIFHIHFPYVEWVFSITAMVLGFIFIKKLLERFSGMKAKNMSLALLLLIFYVSLVLFIFSFVLAPFVPGPAVYAGAAGFILLMIFLVFLFVKKDLKIDGEKVTVVKTIAMYRDRSLLLISLFFIISLYFGLTVTKILPPLYSDQLPQAYYELVNDAESGKEIPENGRYKHEEFKEHYELFLKRNMSGEN
jgi:hypothetical protein